jgi:hypothetical protein
MPSKLPWQNWWQVFWASIESEPGAYVIAKCMGQVTYLNEQ